MIKLERIDIFFYMSLLSSHVALPRDGHLHAAVHVMAHVGQRCNSLKMFNLSYPEIDHSVFNKCNWSEFYWDAKETIPMNAQNHEVRMLISTCLWIVILQEIRYLADQDVAF